MSVDWGDVLAEDETILWQGQPQARATLAGANKRHLVIGTLVTLFYLYALAYPRVNTHWIQSLFNTGMLGVGVSFLIDAVWGKPSRYARTFYAITKGRILIRRVPLWGKARLFVYGIGRSTQVKRTRFNPDHVWFSTRNRTARMKPLRDLADPDGVQTLLKDVIAGQK